MNVFVTLSGLAIVGLVATTLPVSAPAQQLRAVDQTRAEVIQRADAAFARLDTNRDGRFTREEAQTSRQERRAQMRGRMFQRLDADNNGQISREEFARAEHGPGARGPGMRGPGPMGEGGPGMRRGRHPAHGMRMRMGARLFGDTGYVTAEQFRARALQRFDRADANRDGTLTVEERRAHRAERRQHRRGGPPPGAPSAPQPTE